MLKSLLIGLDGSDDGRSVVELGLRWAKRFDALAVGLAVVDEPGIRTSSAVIFEGGHHWHTSDPAPLLLSDSRRRVEQILQQFARRCDQAGVRSTVIEEVGTPFVRILMEAQRHDLILLGRRTHFDYGREGEPDATLGKVLQDSPRPLVTVPASLGAGEAIVVAYDGSLQAARTLPAFVASGLGDGRAVHVVSVASEYGEATRHTDHAIDFLRLHGIDATPHPWATAVATADVILRKVSDLETGLLVMGAYGQPRLREFFLGSVTRAMLKDSPVPIFCYH
jgi:nucleotide-binding universal stress UspA family protein